MANPRCKDCSRFIGKKIHTCPIHAWNKGLKGLWGANSGSFKKGLIPWSKGKKLPPLSEETKRKQSESLKRYYATNPDLSEIGKKISKSKKLHHPYKGKKLPDWWKTKISAGGKGVKRSKEACENIRKAKLGIRRSRETVRKMLLRRPMSGLEIKFEEIINKYNLPYKFVGNGKFFIERKNPDFININGEKKAIEVYCKKHKHKFKNMPIEQWQQERQELFNKYGWQVIFFDETQINEQNVLSILEEGYQ
jgi:very-short-patch-repair endonuclease